MSKRNSILFKIDYFPEFDSYGCEPHFSCPTIINETLNIHSLRRVANVFGATLYL